MPSKRALAAAADQTTAVLSRNVRDFRLLRKMTQTELATSAGVQRSTVASIEGGYAMARASTLSALALVLKVPVADLLRPASPR